MKIIIVTGGVLSGLGKGIITSSLGLLLKQCGYRITVIKVDPYLNVDAGTMNPFEHGEVFVLDDGTEVDLDLGNYERFLDVELTGDHNITTGKVYQAVIEKERKGEYLGATVQIIPHIINEIIMRIEDVARKTNSEITLVEMGGTVGDIESMPFLEAVRELKNKHGNDNVLVVHTTLVPVMGVVGEQKTKPTQHSVKELMSIGIQPDMIMCRSAYELDATPKKKISLFCNVEEEAIFSIYDVPGVHRVPLLFEKQGVSAVVQKKLFLPQKEADFSEWKKYVEGSESARERVKIALVGKYTGLKDSYISHLKALSHAGAALGIKPEIVWIESETLVGNRKEASWKVLKEMEEVDGILIPGGFGVRGIEGKILTARTAREKGIPFLGICLGFEVGVIEFARAVLELEGANSTEFDPDTKYPVIDLLPGQAEVEAKGGTMRLGAQTTLISKDTLAWDIYGKKHIRERHRHRYEVNPSYIERMEKEGYIFSGRSEDGRKMEISEFEDHSFFVGCQFHPEFLTRPNRPAPLFLRFLEEALKRKQGNGGG